ncbi:hypothetical protein BDV95DRAFT_591924 [Massariosphaeria phaeospora]|uniref:RING-type domain-containing protein n=1 Tax=Massariosphaeria phaeospora TaxID=100035 RepID=A0A7C8MRB3_9PLEO|nr:hypothetical protein BDV95DRAFT_591924 [Massariosphaeria phaeospora]
MPGLPSRDEYLQTHLIATAPLAEDLDCPICACPWEWVDNAIVRLLECDHTFHHECIAAWFRAGRSNSNTCPVCRHTVFRSRPPMPDIEPWEVDQQLFIFIMAYINNIDFRRADGMPGLTRAIDTLMQYVTPAWRAAWPMLVLSDPALRFSVLTLVLVRYWGSLTMEQWIDICTMRRELFDSLLYQPEMNEILFFWRVQQVHYIIRPDREFNGVPRNVTIIRRTPGNVITLQVHLLWNPSASNLFYLGDHNQDIIGINQHDFHSQAVTIQVTEVGVGSLRHVWILPAVRTVRFQDDRGYTLSLTFEMWEDELGN